MSCIDPLLNDWLTFTHVADTKQLTFQTIHFSSSCIVWKSNTWWTFSQNEDENSQKITDRYQETYVLLKHLNNCWIHLNTLLCYLSKIPGSGTNLLLSSIVEFAHIIQYILSSLCLIIHVHTVIWWEQKERQLKLYFHYSVIDTHSVLLFSLSSDNTFAPRVEQHVNVIFRSVWWSGLSRWAVCYYIEFVPSNTSSWKGINRQSDCGFCLFNNFCLPGFFPEFWHQWNNHKTVLVYW